MKFALYFCSKALFQPGICNKSFHKIKKICLWNETQNLVLGTLVFAYWWVKIADMFLLSSELNVTSLGHKQEINYSTF